MPVGHAYRTRERTPSRNPKRGQLRVRILGLTGGGATPKVDERVVLQRCVSHYRNLYSTAALEAAAGRLLDDPQLRASLSAAASDAVRAYDWPVVARDVLKVYQAVIPAAGKVAVAP